MSLMYLKLFSNNNGIKVQYTIPRTPKQNGVAERYNGTLFDKARCLIFEVKMNKVFLRKQWIPLIFLIEHPQVYYPVT